MCPLPYLLIRLCGSSRVEREAIVEGEVRSHCRDGGAIRSDPYYWYIEGLALSSLFFLAMIFAVVIFHFNYLNGANVTISIDFLSLSSFSWQLFFFLIINTLWPTDIPGYGNMSAVTMCERLDIKSCKVGQLTVPLPSFLYHFISVYFLQIPLILYTLLASILTNAGHGEAEEGERRGLSKGFL